MFLEDKLVLAVSGYQEPYDFASLDYHALPTSISYNWDREETNKYLVKYVENFIRTLSGCRWFAFGS